MPMHRIYIPDIPGGYTTCLCVRGHDHDEADFDIPLGHHRGDNEVGEYEVGQDERGHEPSDSRPS